MNTDDKLYDIGNSLTDIKAVWNRLIYSIEQTVNFETVFSARHKKENHLPKCSAPKQNKHDYLSLAKYIVDRWMALVLI